MTMTKFLALSGPQLGFLGFLLYSIFDAGLKYMQMDHSMSVTMAVTQLVCAALVLAYIAARGQWQALKPRRLWFLLVYCVLFVLDNSGFLYAVGRIPLAPLMVIILTAPIFNVLLARLVLRETIAPYQTVSIVFGFVGILIMLQPWEGVSLQQIGDYDGLAVLAAFVALACFCIKIILIRKFGESENGVTLNFWGAAVLALIFTPLAGKDLLSISPDGWIVGVGAGIVCAAAAGALNLAFARGPVALVAPQHFSQMLWAALLGYVFWNEIPRSAVYIGGLCILAGGLALAWTQFKGRYLQTI
jgi:drug/metabolite transporter (DMT)-like permease